MTSDGDNDSADGGEGAEANVRDDNDERLSRAGLGDSDNASGDFGVLDTGVATDESTAAAAAAWSMAAARHLSSCMM